ncbi:MAG: molybdopterin dehydrogenase [Acidobacteria bacterium 21-70-11]|nr:MAG: molybdopterin dehydrogenase [Acidobacteria bacterium 21-70-11]HQU33793.1 FAD binding domain-containing protein [Thermoanaerobaculaceae bacterium]
MIPAFNYVRPASLAEACAKLASPGTHAHAGGTDLLGCLRDGVFAADTVVSLSDIPDLRGVRKNLDGGLLIGAMTTLAEVAADQAVAAGYAALAEGALSAASPQLRNQGTLGGNLCQRPRCWYYRGDFHCARKGGDKCYAVEGENQFHCVFGGNVCFYVHPSDAAPALVALDATVRITGKNGSRSVPVAQFFVGPETDYTRETVLAPGELVTEIVLPPQPAGTRGAYRKVRARGSWDFALAGAAVVATVAGGRVTRMRIVLSGAAPVPWRVPEAEREVTGQRLTTQVARRAAAAAVKGAEPLAENGYKVELLRGAVEEALLRLA